MRLRRPHAALLLGILAGCGGDGPRADGADAALNEGPAGPLLVSAAASLTDAFEDIAGAFEAEHPGVRVQLNLGGSSALREQILEGAPVDVFASANRPNMDRLLEAGAVSGQPRIFALNRLQIAVPPGNPARVGGLADLAAPSRLIGLCDPSVPCGAFARDALRRAGVTASPDTNEPDVRALLSKIELGELDAGITYATDVAAARGRVEGVEIPDSVNVVAEYPIAVLAAAPHPAVAEAFVAFVLGDEGRALLAARGFAVR